MPQSITANWRYKDIPYGKGSLHGQTLEASFRHWRRATKINEAENHRCRMMTSLLEKHHRAAENRKERVIQRLRKTIEEREAYKRVLESYRASKLRTLQWGFKLQPCATPRTYQRYKLERRVYDCGFSIDTLRPEVTHVIESNKPEVRRRLAHEKLLEVARKQSNFIIRATMTSGDVLGGQDTVSVRLPSVRPRQRSVVHASRSLLASLDK